MVGIELNFLRCGIPLAIEEDCRGECVCIYRPQNPNCTVRKMSIRIKKRNNSSSPWSRVCEGDVPFNDFRWQSQNGICLFRSQRSVVVRGSRGRRQSAHVRRMGLIWSVERLRRDELVRSLSERQRRRITTFSRVNHIPSIAEPTTITDLWLSCKVQSRCVASDEAVCVGDGHDRYRP